MSLRDVHCHTAVSLDREFESQQRALDRHQQFQSETGVIFGVILVLRTVDSQIDCCNDKQHNMHALKLVLCSSIVVVQ
jgi:hypothetical protein